MTHHSGKYKRPWVQARGTVPLLQPAQQGRLGMSLMYLREYFADAVQRRGMGGKIQTTAGKPETEPRLHGSLDNVTG